MAALQSRVSSDLHTHNHRNHTNSTIASAMTREDLLILAQNEYARQLCKFTEAQLKKKVPCYTEQKKLGIETLSAVKATQEQH